MGSIVTPFNQLASALNRATATENHEIIGVVDHLVLEKLTPSGDPPVLRKRFMYRWASKLRGVSGKRAAHQEPTGGPTPQVGISRVARSRRHFYESATNRQGGFALIDAALRRDSNLEMHNSLVP